MRIIRITLLVLLAAAWTTGTLHFHRVFAQSKDQTKDDDKKTPEKKQPKIEPLDEEMLRRAKIDTDAPALMSFFHKRVLVDKDRPEIEQLVERLGSSVYLVREKASNALINRGVAAVEILRHAAVKTKGLEHLRRIESVLLRIQENDVPPEVPAAAVRALAVLEPKDLNKALLEYLPFADNEAVVDEIRIVLTKHALIEGKADPALVTALADRAPLRRATAAEAIGRTAFDAHKDALQKLLRDADANVRFRTARTLAFAKERDAIPVVIDSLPDLPLNAAWQAEDFLLQLAASHNPPAAPMGNDKEARDKCKAAWSDWWKKNGAKIDLAKLEESPKLLGRTLVVLLDQNRVMELGPDKKPRLDIKNIVFPLDAQLLEDDRVLIAEYHGNRVTERNAKGEVVWQRAVGTPLVAQRLANGNTFVATPFSLLEYDKNNQEVLNVQLATDMQYIMKAMKLPNGEIACMLGDARIARFNAKGKELSSFPIPLGMRLFGGRIHMLPSGRVLVPHNAENKVVEYDAKGKVVWELAFEQPIAATRLPNGNTLITSMNPQIGAVEVNRAGRQLWSYQDASNTRVTRAIRR
jgi:hypothetical protein